MKDGCGPVAIIPVRAQASRFPGKILTKINGKPMIQWVWESASRAKRLGAVYVATGDSEIAEAVKDFGGSVLNTPVELPSGTDRVAYAARELSAQIFINLQGDEPLLRPESIDALVNALENDANLEMATLAVRKNDPEMLKDPNTIKVIFSQTNDALYFSRQPLLASPTGDFFKHIGIYGFRKKALQRFCELAPSRLEKAERLEQLRALENGMRIRVVVQERDTIAVDHPNDVRRVEQFLKEL